MFPFSFFFSSTICFFTFWPYFCETKIQNIIKKEKDNGNEIQKMEVKRSFKTKIKTKSRKKWNRKMEVNWLIHELLYQFGTKQKRNLGFVVHFGEEQVEFGIKKK